MSTKSNRGNIFKKKKKKKPTNQTILAGPKNHEFNIKE